VHPRTLEFLRELAGDEGVAVVVRGDCMEPLIRGGARLTVRKRRFYFPGDVIVFRTPNGELAAHRILGYRRAGGGMAFVTKGDHCLRHDAPIEPSMVVGAVEGLAIHYGDRLGALARLGGIIVRRLRR